MSVAGADPVHPTVHPTLAGLAARVGQALGSSPWLAIEQSRIDAFAQATGDHQWIHVDPARAAAGPFGATIAHGYLTLSLLPLLAEQAFEIADVRMGINYGLNKLRFPHPVRVGSRIRAHFELTAFEPLPDGSVQLTTLATVEIEGVPKPALVAEMLTRRHA
jgi:acyl dehydratase